MSLKAAFDTPCIQNTRPFGAAGMPIVTPQRKHCL
jgi:hypothetical protein